MAISLFTSPAKVASSISVACGPLIAAKGPNLTDVVYTGLSADGKIAATIRVSTPRCDDINRAYHYFRYEVLEPVAFQRLAFYQLGADHYNDHQFTTLARGNAEGLVEQWEPPRGGAAYSRREIACEGEAPWFSLHDTVTNTDARGGANRGLVIRAWQARLGGVDVPVPSASVFGTEDHFPMPT